MWVAGQGYSFKPSQMLLIETQGENPSDPPIRQIVHLLAEGDPGGPPVKETCDDIFTLPVSHGGPPYLTCLGSPPTAAKAPTAVTRIAWRSSDALTVARDLSETVVIGNIANATQGRTATEVFLIGPPPNGEAQPPPSAIERIGPQPLISPGFCGTPPTIRLHTLANAPLAWLPQPTLDPSGLPMPEITLNETSGSGAWNWVRSLLLAEQFDQSFTIDPVAYATITTNSDLTVQSDYASDQGNTIRFGDSVFGANPNDGMSFTVMAILTTNMRQVIDQAFLRASASRWSSPSPTRRTAQRSGGRFSREATRTDRLDYERLACLRLAGGSIRNIALNGAFLAAETGEPVRMGHLRRAAQAEYAKLERRLTPSEAAAWPAGDVDASPPTEADAWA